MADLHTLLRSPQRSERLITRKVLTGFSAGLREAIADPTPAVKYDRIVEESSHVADVSDTGEKDECRLTGKGKKREMDEAMYLIYKRPGTSTYSKRTPADSVEKTNEKHGASVPQSGDDVQDCTTSATNHSSSDTHTVVADIGEKSILIATLSEENVPEPEPMSRRSDDQTKVSSADNNPASATPPTNFGGEGQENSLVLNTPSSGSSGTNNLSRDGIRFGQVLEATGEGVIAKKDAEDSSVTFENEDELRRCLLIHDICGLV